MEAQFSKFLVGLSKKRKAVEDCACSQTELVRSNAVTVGEQ